MMEIIITGIAIALLVLWIIVIKQSITINHLIDASNEHADAIETIVKPVDIIDRKASLHKTPNVSKHTAIVMPADPTMAQKNWLKELGYYSKEDIKINSPIIPIIQIYELAQKHDWKIVDYQASNSMLSFVARIIIDGIRINIYLSTMTVGTCLDHPKKGKNQMFRRNVTIDELAKMFEYPRAHLNKGYHTK